ncbi:MAG: alpha/beta fold hydrolase [Nevskia sp.]
MASAALAAVAVALWRLHQATAGLSITPAHIGTIPVTVFEPASHEPAPVIVIGHGFAGSQQLMQPYAITLARNGYIAVTFDFQGHGRNPAPLSGSFTDQEAFSRGLAATLAAVVDAVAHRPGSDGRVALLGHSMASDVVVRYAMSHPEIEATVAVSLFFAGASATSPRNLLILDGALEPASLHDEGLRIVASTAGGAPKAGVTYGDFADGNARRIVLAPGVEHIGILYSREGLHETLSWLDTAFGRSGSGFVDARGGALGLLYLGIIALAWPLSYLLPRIAVRPVGADPGWRRLLPIAIAPALLTPLILWRLPTAFLPLLLGDYLALHFALYGLLTFAGMRLLLTRAQPAASAPGSAAAFASTAIAASAYGVFAIGLTIDRYVTSFLPGAGRLPLILAMLAGTLLYFLSDEWLTRGATAARGRYAATKLCFLLSLVIAVALNLEKLFFLVIIVPVILIMFIVYGLFSGWIYRRTGHPLAAAIANALAFAWFIAVTFPVVSR